MTTTRRPNRDPRLARPSKKSAEEIIEECDDLAEVDAYLAAGRKRVARDRARLLAPPSEEVEQRALATWLDYQRVTYCHVPNGGLRTKAVAGKLRAAGVKAGVPDVLIFDLIPCVSDRPASRGNEWCRDHDPSPLAPGAIAGAVTAECRENIRGIALELKRAKAKGHPHGRVSDEQDAWHKKLVDRGWIVLVAYGANDAIEQLVRLGVGRK